MNRFFLLFKTGNRIAPGVKYFFYFLFIALLLFTEAYATNYYIATDGKSTNSGTSISSPFKDISQAVGLAIAGDIIYIREGTYILTSTISLSKTGSEAYLYTMQGYPGEEQPLLDFSAQAFGSRGISLSGSYWYIKGIRIKGAGDNGLHISGNYNIIEFCSFFENRDSGLQLSNGASNNRVINCDSYYNADPTDYGDADGFAVKMDVGTGNYFYGCRAWLNCDDGWDGYLRGTDDVTTTLENCWSSWNGYFKDGTDAGINANGNGFKMGGSDDKTLKHNFILKNCLAYCNKDKCFDQNNNKGSMTLYNCTAFGGLRNYVINSTLADGKTASLVNCVSLDGSLQLGTFVEQKTNSWQLFSIDSNDFLSIDTAETYSTRKTDGSLPDILFMHLQTNPPTELIDAGTILEGIEYAGTKPDLGCFELGLSTSLPFYDFINNKLRISPNPAESYFVVSALEVNDDIFIYSIDGKIQKQLISKSTIQTIDIADLKKGLYVIRIKNQTIKLIKL